MTVTRTDLANAIRVLAMDAVEKANSGHPGMPMGMADIAEVLWNDFLVHNPANPHWAGRDRFILSNGHGSMLQYALLHLSGYDLSIDDLKQFRQWHSKTPGHPEYRDAPGVETTTGPLGQGIANGVGMALAERMLAARFNRPDHEIVSNYTYVFLGDGCLMEGVSHEACSLAGVWGLNKLVCFYDDNNISIDGHVDDWFGDDTPARFEAYGWHVVRHVDGHDPEAIKKAIAQAHKQTTKPTLICCKTVIGHGSPNKAGTHDVHGAALGAEEVALTRKNLGWSGAPFEIPEAIYHGFNAKAKGEKAESDWKEKFAKYKANFPKEAAEFERRLSGEASPEFDAAIARMISEFRKENPKIATRVASGKTIQGIAASLPEFLGGSADLTPSNNTRWKEAIDIGKHRLMGNYIHYGVREFGMSAIMNGVSLYGGFLPFGGTFLIFSDYSRNAIRMSALMGIRVVYVMTHDSIGLGEDGPTHQPVEQVNSLRLIPNLNVWRPADAVETAIAWESSVKLQRTPSLLALSRQNLPALPHTDETVANARRGGYVIKDAEGGKAQGILIATGSEVELALAAQAKLAEQGHAVRVVSMPCMDIFAAQDAAYQESVLPAGISKRVAIEAGTTGLWYKYVGLHGAVVGIDHFGASAPAATLFAKFGFTVDNIIAQFQAL
ncbi:transketolase [Acidithiobacillus thiooxidans]|uniref:Transketolase n=1 Tax=Acidithiobacillus thiooxidans ATCC 19377 TaxID=637390 RepID=A0A543Q6B4_ACITH|nr:transketolase [Acidithiobacillus thiooxidans]MBU2842397.1 transketolase [Acidithiobacillus thiooxidans]MDR7928516.1 transketolase [Acidithiobacillus thiooxidans]MDX5933919.1 transketolase [Acidithiobacillus thiooxidans]TQN51863.1 Transketolase 1 [Acidithiobacillus thiooxidans ATCC 19377]